MMIPLCPSRSNIRSKAVSAARIIGGVGLVLYSAASGAALPEPSEAEIAAISQRLLDAGCNSYALTPPVYSACIHRRARELPPLDPSKREHFGEQYDPTRYLECMKVSYRNYQGCDRYELRRVDNPEYWPYPEVQGIKWPDQPKESVYRWGMSGKDYFEALCKAEAGEFIYKTVEGVDSIYQIRPRIAEFSNAQQQDRYVIEAPYFLEVWDDAPGGLFSSAIGYPNFEVTTQRDGRMRYRGAEGKYYDVSMAAQPDQGEKFSRFYKINNTGRLNDTRKVMSDELISRYGFTWRSISRPNDRSDAIAGGELAVADLRTGEVLGLKRTFSYSTGARTQTGIYWAGSQPCPGDSNDTFRVLKFLVKVLQPTPAAQLQEKAQ